jgi:ribosomal protein L15
MGLLERPITVVADAFSEKAKQIIESAGGRAEVRKP